MSTDIVKRIGLGVMARAVMASQAAADDATETMPAATETSQFVAKIIAYPDDRLRAVSRPVAIEDDAAMTMIRKLVLAMREAMHDRGGIGLAAMQIGVPVNLFVVHVRNETSEPLVFVNPEIVAVSPDNCEITEGCLSLGLERDLIARPRTCTVKRFDQYGRRDTHEYRGMTARAILHEYDHLKGRLFIDYLSATRQRMMLRSMERRTKKKQVRDQQAAMTHTPALA